MVKYVFRDVPLILQNKEKADPQRLGEAIDKARKLTPDGDDVRETLVKAARNKRHALHHHLEWEDSVAAHKYRLEQVNDVIRVIAMEDEETGETRPAFISIVASGAHRAFYSPHEIQRSVELQSAALLAAERDLDSFTKRHRWLSDICQAVSELREEVRRRRVDSSPAEKRSA